MIAASLAMPMLAHAEPRHNIGFGVDIGVPDGLALDLSIKPNLPWLHGDLAVTNNVMAWGVRGGVGIDPINYVVSPIAVFEYGRYFSNNIPHENVTLAYDYANAHIGLATGSQSKFRFFFRGGVSWLWVNADHVNSLFSGISGVALSNTKVQLMIPSLKLGFNYYF